MTVYMGVDFHPYTQTVAWCNTKDGEIRFRTFKHSDKEALNSFYKELGEPAKSRALSGSTRWTDRRAKNTG